MSLQLPHVENNDLPICSTGGEEVASAIEADAGDMTGFEGLVLVFGIVLGETEGVVECEIHG
jgi:hypothetical protein